MDKQNKQTKLQKKEKTHNQCNNTTTTSKVDFQNMWEHERLELIDEIIQNSSNDKTKPQN
jgi:hypothetical protein